MDPRTARTRRGLQEALLALARERPLEQITVGDIAERAGINRSTYYQHFGDKEMLLADALDAAATSAAERIDGLSGTGATGQGVDVDGAQAALLTYLRHVEDNLDLYRRVLAEPGSVVATRRVRRRVEAIVGDGLSSTSPDVPEVPLAVAAAGITGLVIGVLTAWVEQEPAAPAPDVARWLWRMLDHHGLPYR